RLLGMDHREYTRPATLDGFARSVEHLGRDSVRRHTHTLGLLATVTRKEFEGRDTALDQVRNLLEVLFDSRYRSHPEIDVRLEGGLAGLDSGIDQAPAWLGTEQRGGDERRDTPGSRVAGLGHQLLVEARLARFRTEAKVYVRVDDTGED